MYRHAPQIYEIARNTILTTLIKISPFPREPRSILTPKRSLKEHAYIADIRQRYARLYFATFHAAEDKLI